MAWPNLKAIILDVDGTLYRQGPLRRAMALRLFRTYALRPADLLATAKLLRAFRHAQELLRKSGPVEDVEEEQLRLACRRTGVAARTARDCISRWMETEPLALIERFVYPGLTQFLGAARDRGLRLAVFSDYEPSRKLESMGLRGYFEIAASAQDPEIQAFKPNPRGLAVVARRLGVERSEILYVGDRPEVDGRAAQSAGMAYAIIGSQSFPGYKEITHAIARR